MKTKKELEREIQKLQNSYNPYLMTREEMDEIERKINDLVHKINEMEK